MKEYFDKLWGDGGRVGKWKGFRVRTLQDDVEEGKAIIMEDDDFVEYKDEEYKDEEYKDEKSYGPPM